MSTKEEPHENPVRRKAWESMSEAMRKTVRTAPLIPQIATRAKEVAARNPEFIRGDQGQVVGVMPDREIYYGPSSGLPELRSLAARFWTLAYGLTGREGVPEGGLGAEHAAVVSGATEGLAILMRMLAPGRRVGLPRLHWGNYRNLISLAGGEPVLLDFFGPDGALDREGLAAVLEEREVGVLVLNFPNNPTGDVLVDDELSALASLARERELVLISDEVYNWVRYDDQPRSMLAFAPERTVVVGAASKEYLIPGARTGYILCADAPFCDEWMPRLIRATSSSPNVLGQRLATEMLRPDVEDLEQGRPPRILGAVKEELRRRRDRMAGALREAGLTLVGRWNDLPRGGISMLGRLPAGLEDDAAFLERAMEEERFSAIPGSAFGAPGCIRFGYAGIPVEGIERMGRHLRELADELLRT
jgi:aspartate/methionine/tyrosine aminotransferase